jgi:CHAT domain-containing protein
MLVGNALRKVPPGALLVVIPDGDLAGVPYASLFDHRRGKYIVETYDVVVAKSFTAYVRGSKSYHGLIVRPLFVAVSAGTLKPALPNASAEVEAVARLYSTPVVLDGSDATRPRLIKALRVADLFHFAGHAEVNQYRPADSFLCLAATAGESDAEVLKISDIVAMKILPRIVILSACSTAQSVTLGQDGLTLAEAFLLAGTQVVVGTLHPVTDRIAKEFSKRFHESLAAGIRPAQATARAQRSLANDRDKELNSPSGWGAFQIMGTS